MSTASLSSLFLADFYILGKGQRKNGVCKEERKKNAPAFGQRPVLPYVALRFWLNESVSPTDHHALQNPARGGRREQGLSSV